MDDAATQQLEDEFRNATAQNGAGTGSSKPRISTGKLKMPTVRQERHVMPATKPRHTGGRKNLRRLEGGPSRDTFDQLSSPERGKRRPRTKAVLEGEISPRRGDTRNVVQQPVPREELATAPSLEAPTARKSPHRSPRKRNNEPDLIENELPEEEVVHQVCSPVPDKSSQALNNAVESESYARDGSDGHELGSTRHPSEGSEQNRHPNKPTATKRKNRSSRSSRPVASSAREPASGGVERSSPQVVIPAVKKIRPGSIFPLGDDITEAASDDQTDQRPIERPVPRKQPRDHHAKPVNYQLQPTEPESNKRHEAPQKSRKRRAVTPEATVQPSKTAKRSHRAVNLGQNHELFGQQPLLRQAYQTVEKIGWSYKGEEHVQNDVDLDDDQVISLKKLCREARTKMSELTAGPDDEELVSDPPEELPRICNGVHVLGTKQEYFVDENKVNNIYFHLFPSLVKLVRHTIDCYGEMDKEADGLTTQRAITIHHLGVVVSLLRAITSLYETLGRKYCEPRKGLCVKQPIMQIVVALRQVQDRFLREIRRHSEKEQQRIEDEARAETERLIDERLEREEVLAKERAAIRKKWLLLHDERRAVDANILPRWKKLHLLVPDLTQSDQDSNGEPFERVEVFTSRGIGPSYASTERARSVEWSLIELHALRTGLEEFAGERLWVKMFRRYCVRGAPLHRFNVTEIVTIAADMLKYEEDRQSREFGTVEEWARVAKEQMWTKPKIQRGGQENHVRGA